MKRSGSRAMGHVARVVLVDLAVATPPDLSAIRVRTHIHTAAMTAAAARPMPMPVTAVVVISSTTIRTAMCIFVVVAITITVGAVPSVSPVMYRCPCPRLQPCL